MAVVKEIPKCHGSKRGLPLRCCLLAASPKTVTGACNQVLGDHEQRIEPNTQNFGQREDRFIKQSYTPQNMGADQLEQRLALSSQRDCILIVGILPG